jgi:uncharacterized integral membrane protein (TIGR00697 family)
MSDAPEPDLAPAPKAPAPHALALTRGQALYVWLAAFFTADLLLADIVGVKLFRIDLGFWQIDHTCGMLTFPLTFIITDLANDYYGKKATRRLTYLAFGMGVFALCVLQVAQSMPFLDAPYNVSQAAYDQVLGSSKLMYVASLIAYLIGQTLDIAVFGFMKRLTRGRYLWLRATGSTVISQAIDSLIVTFLYFKSKDLQGGATTPFLTILGIAKNGYLLKFIMAVGVTPFIYLGHKLMHEWFELAPVPVDEA